MTMQLVIFRKGKPLFSFDPMVEGKYDDFFRWLRTLGDYGVRKECILLEQMAEIKIGERLYTHPETDQQNNDIYLTKVTNVIPVSRDLRKPK